MQYFLAKHCGTLGLYPFTDFAEICSFGAIVRICVCGHKQVMQLECPMVQGPGEVFTFHNGLLHALGPERCVDPCCPSHDPNVPVILLGDNGTARRSNIFTGSMSYYSRRLAKILAQLDEGEVSFRKVYYGWINGEDNVADYYVRHMISGNLGNGEIWVSVRLVICAQNLAGFEWTICHILLSNVHYEPMFCGYILRSSPMFP